MKKHYCIFVVSNVYITSESDSYTSWDVHSEGLAVVPYCLGEFETEEEAEQWLENDLNHPNNEYRDCRFLIQKIYVRK